MLQIIKKKYVYVYTIELNDRKNKQKEDLMDQKKFSLLFCMELK